MSAITLYTAKICPYGHRVEIALTEAKAKFKTYQIDLWDKPEWYGPKVYPAAKIPAIAYGGPDVPPEDPSPESVKLAESLILVEFIADLFPEANLLSKGPVFRAQARFFAEVVSSKLVPAYTKFIVRGEGYEDLLAAIETIQDLLPAGGTYATGEQYTIADIAIAPFIARLKLAATNELGRYPVGQGGKFLKAYGDDKYAKFDAYARRVVDRPSFETTFDAEHNKDAYAKRFARV